LESALQYDAGYLIFLTDDIPDEDSLNIHLVDCTGAPRDRARIGSPYSTGRFRNLEIQSPDKVKFRFLGDTVWTLRILQKPALRIPFLSESVCVHRPSGFQRRFSITGNPC
jgi:hypothetical protein